MSESLRNKRKRIVRDNQLLYLIVSVIATTRVLVLLFINKPIRAVIALDRVRGRSLFCLPRRGLGYCKEFSHQGVLSVPIHRAGNYVLSPIQRYMEDSL